MTFSAKAALKHPTTLSAFAADLDFANAAACRTITAATASGTNRFLRE